MKIEEITSKREKYGGADGNAINRHQFRVYLCDGMEFILDRITDAKPPYYNLHYFKSAGTATTVPVSDNDYWGDGLNWENAEKLAKEAIEWFVVNR